MAELRDRRNRWGSPMTPTRASAFDAVTAIVFGTLAAFIAGLDYVPWWVRSGYVALVVAFLLLFALQRYLEAKLAELSAEIKLTAAGLR